MDGNRYPWFTFINVDVRVAVDDLHSDSRDWLVDIGSNCAKFKGTGFINGEGEYKFQIWAGDGSPDAVRIKIRDADTDAVISILHFSGGV